MTRRMYQLVFASVLVGLSLTGIACGGSKEADQPSNAPVGKPANGEVAPTAAGGAMTDGGSQKMSGDGQTVPRSK
jgi:hypothetical protein